jgi:choice-of-anchor A domain-containing protein
VEGRIAAANDVTGATTIGSNLRSDPYGSLAGGYAMVAGVGVTTSSYFNINGGGNVYAANGGGNYNWNDGGKLVSTGSDPIDFTSSTGLRTTLDNESTQLAKLTPNGTVTLGASSKNPSWLVLSGTSKTLNVFTVTALQFASTNNPLDIEVPAGSTVIINVEGTNVTLGTGIYFNGQQESDSNNDSGMILFNFPDASTVAIDGQLDGAVLAPFATLTGNSQMGGNFIAAAIGQTGEVHYDAFEGTLPSTPSPTPEPGSLTLMGSGLLFMTGWLARKRLSKRA